MAKNGSNSGVNGIPVKSTEDCHLTVDQWKKVCPNIEIHICKEVCFQLRELIIPLVTLVINKAPAVFKDSLDPFLRIAVSIVNSAKKFHMGYINGVMSVSMKTYSNPNIEFASVNKSEVINVKNLTTAGEDV